MLSARVDDAASLAGGIPSFPTPEYIISGVVYRLEHDEEIGKYALPDGLEELRQLVARKHGIETGISVDADQHVMFTAGNMEGMTDDYRPLRSCSMRPSRAKARINNPKG